MNNTLLNTGPKSFRKLPHKLSSLNSKIISIDDILIFYIDPFNMINDLIHDYYPKI